MEVIVIKIHVLGGAGSGKSYIANQISNDFNILHFDLDDIFWDNSSEYFGVKAPVELRDAKLEEIIQNDSWIIEGV